MMINVWVDPSKTEAAPPSNGMIAAGMHVGSQRHFGPHEATVTQSAFSPLCSCNCDNLLAPLPRSSFGGWRDEEAVQAAWPWPLPRPFLFTGALAKAFPVASIADHVHDVFGGGAGMRMPRPALFEPTNETAAFVVTI